MHFAESFAHGTLPAVLGSKVFGHRVNDEIVEARRCTVQMQNGFLYLDAIASQATSLLGHDTPEPGAPDHAALLRSLTKLHPEYVCLAVCAETADAVLLARRIGVSIAGDAQAIRLIAAENGPPKDGAGFVIAIENESLGRRGIWFSGAEGGARPPLIVAGNVLAAGRDFGAVFIERSLASRVPASALTGFSPPPEQTVAVVQAVLYAVEAQQLIARARDLKGYFRARLESVQTSCSDIAEIQFAGLSARIRLIPGVSAVQLKRRLCERGLLVGVDDRGWLLIRPPLAIRPAEIDVISGVLRGALLGTATARAPVCCPACQGEPA